MHYVFYILASYGAVLSTLYAVRHTVHIQTNLLRMWNEMLDQFTKRLLLLKKVKSTL